MKNILNRQMTGVIDATTYISSLEPIMKNRSVASLPFAGRNRLVDFMLSNMVHAGMDNVAVFARHNNRSLREHIGTGKSWDLDRKRGGLFFHVPSYEGDPADAKSILEYNVDFFLHATHQYVLITNGYVLGEISFKKALQQHIKTNADMTELAHGDKNLNICILERETLIQLLEKRSLQRGERLIEFIRAVGTELTTETYEVEGQIMVVDSLESYYAHSMSLLNPEVRKAMFPKAKPVITKVKDAPPTKYEVGSSVKNSIVANGCILGGTIENSIISRGVKVGKNTIIRNSIIMQETEIGDNCIIDGVITDKAVKISAGNRIEAVEEGTPRLISKGTNICEQELSLV